MRTLKRWVTGCAMTIAVALAASAVTAEENTPLAIDVAPVTAGNWYQPPVGVSWQWQLFVDDDRPLNTTYDAQLYNVDLFNTPMSAIRSLQADGRKVTCYFSAGTHENYRPDRDQFTDAELGDRLEDWPGERWVDIRSANVRRIMTARLDLAAEKGCDAVEPDNVQGYLEPSGFDFDAQDQLAYNRFIANEAHRRALGVGLKNALQQVELLVDYFDFSINEQCFQYNECDLLLPFIRAGKPVLNAEYPEDEGQPDRSAIASLCNAADKVKFSTLVLPVALDDSFRVACQDR